MQDDYTRYAKDVRDAMPHVKEVKQDIAHARAQPGASGPFPLDN